MFRKIAVRSHSEVMEQLNTQLHGFVSKMEDRADLKRKNLRCLEAAISKFPIRAQSNEVPPKFACNIKKTRVNLKDVVVPIARTATGPHASIFPRKMRSFRKHADKPKMSGLGKSVCRNAVLAARNFRPMLILI